MPIWPYQFFYTLQSDRRSDPIIVVWRITVVLATVRLNIELHEIRVLNNEIYVEYINRSIKKSRLSRQKGFTDDSRKVRFAQTHRTIRTGWFAQQGMIGAILWMFCASKLLCCVSFKLRFNYFIYLIYLIYQLFVWALLVADVNLGYMHLSTKYYTL